MQQKFNINLKRNMVSKEKEPKIKEYTNLKISGLKKKTPKQKWKVVFSVYYETTKTPQHWESSGDSQHKFTLFYSVFWRKREKNYRRWPHPIDFVRKRDGGWELQRNGANDLTEKNGFEENKVEDLVKIIGGLVKIIWRDLINVAIIFFFQKVVP